ncbi:MAG: flavodoxin domain-containing protein [Eubacteriales bacterium]|nr:flavodoxin domain-containing protein [Eubacteriales bacterium]
MKGIILYQSKYGATKRYADWLAEETGFPVVETKKAQIDDVAQYDTVILGGGIYASGVAGLSFLKKNIDRLSNKKIIVFCVGASPYEEETIKYIADHNMQGQLQNMPFFYCRGVWDMDGMNLLDRSLCRLLKKSVSKKDPADYELWEKALMDARDEKCDWTDKAYIEPILEEIKKS